MSGATRAGPAGGRALVAFVLGVLVLVDARHAEAQAGNGTTKDSLDWPYATFRPWEYVATGVFGIAGFFIYNFAQGPTTPHWTGGILFDNAVRDALRVRSPGGRDAVRKASDVVGFSTILIAVGVDSLAVPLLRGSSRTALQQLLVDAEAFAFNSVVTTGTYDLVGRARPSYDDCLKDPSVDPLCYSGNTASFWSGHSALAFTAAGLSCAHHVYLHIYGDPTADALGCAGMITLASATGTLRVLGDRHYATDVLTGALVGFGFGYGVPTLFHYAAGPIDSMAVTPSSAGLGLALSGTF